MGDIVITGASRGIGRALAIAAASRREADTRLILVARDEAMLRDVALEAERLGASALCVPGDLSTLSGAQKLGNDLAAQVRVPATLVHNAGVWPSRRVLTSDGLETAFVVNCLGPLLTQQVLLAQSLVDRIMVISAGLIVAGRFSADRTPTGLDFSRWRTYCNTKLAFAIAERDIAEQHPAVDVLVLHPGIVRTDLGAQAGLLGSLLGWTKRFWESPEACAARLQGLLERDRWSPPGDARWWVESRERPWPAAAENQRARREVREMVARYSAAGGNAMR